MSRFSELSESKRRPDILTEIIAKLDKESYEDFRKALADKSISTYHISNVLSELGVQVHRSTLEQWRRRGV
jgi:hypothetical protein